MGRAFGHGPKRPYHPEGISSTCESAARAIAFDRYADYVPAKEAPEDMARLREQAISNGAQLIRQVEYELRASAQEIGKIYE